MWRKLNLKGKATSREHQKIHPTNISNITEAPNQTEKVHDIPSVLEVTDLENKRFKVSDLIGMEDKIILFSYYDDFQFNWAFLILALSMWGFNPGLILD